MIRTNSFMLTPGTNDLTEINCVGVKSPIFKPLDTETYTGEPPTACDRNEDTEYLSCGLCEKSFLDQRSIGRHKKKIHGILKPFACNSCPKAFKSAYDLRKHTENCHAVTNMFLCHLCDGTFPSLSDLRGHYSAKHGESNAEGHRVCDVCDKAFTQPKHLRRHELIHTNLRPYKCDRERCTKTYRQQSHLEAHVRSAHGKTRDHSCRECGKSFTLLRNLRSHCLTHVHITRRPYWCNVCKNGFTTKAILQRHSLIHTDKKVQCPYCSKSYAQTATLYKHLQKLHADQLLPCASCSQTFLSKAQLESHLIQCHPWPCTRCQAVFSSNNSLLEHIFRNHTSPSTSTNNLSETVLDLSDPWKEDVSHWEDLVQSVDMSAMASYLNAEQSASLADTPASINSSQDGSQSISIPTDLSSTIDFDGLDTLFLDQMPTEESWSAGQGPTDASTIATVPSTTTTVTFTLQYPRSSSQSKADPPPRRADTPTKHAVEYQSPTVYFVKQNIDRADKSRPDGYKTTCNHCKAQFSQADDFVKHWEGHLRERHLSSPV